MRNIVLAIVTILCAPCALSAQLPKGPSPEAQRANRHYAQGWTAMRAEAWAEAAQEFKEALDSDPKFALAYYSLGRAEMGRRDFSRAIAAYTKCRDLYVSGGGERYTSQLDATRRITDRILEYRMALTQATQNTGPKSSTQSQSLYIRELETQITRLEQARDRNLNLTFDASVPYFVPMALGAAYFRSGQVADAEREYKAALDANPRSGETHSNLAVLYLTTDRLDQATREIKLAEDTGFKVNSNLKDEINRKKRGGL